MKHFNYIENEGIKELFYKSPTNITMNSIKTTLEYALGATLYMPATRKNIDDMLVENKYPELSSLVICLEDAIGDNEIEIAEKNLIRVLENIFIAIESNKYDRGKLPLLFIRVRNSEHLISLSKKIELYSEIIVGFVFPKFDNISGVSYLKALNIVNKKLIKKYYFMPVLETENIIYIEKRLENLDEISKLLIKNSEFLLNVRIGATDFSSLFGLRRSKDFTIYDISIIRDCISDILNFFTRKDTEYVVSGAVWEYFNNNERILKPLLRNTLFNEHLGEEGKLIRTNLIKNNLDALIREILLDRENGIIGKTVIHPSHISLVNSLYVVTKEEYLDAKCIINESSNGVIKSKYNNKMNEIKPHERWARRIIKRSEIYGVFNEGYDFVSLLSYRRKI